MLWFYESIQLGNSQGPCAVYVDGHCAILAQWSHHWAVSVNQLRNWERLESWQQLLRLVLLLSVALTVCRTIMVNFLMMGKHLIHFLCACQNCLQLFMPSLLLRHSVLVSVTGWHTWYAAGACVKLLKCWCDAWRLRERDAGRSPATLVLAHGHQTLTSAIFMWNILPARLALESNSCACFAASVPNSQASVCDILLRKLQESEAWKLDLGVCSNTTVQRKLHSAEQSFLFQKLIIPPQFGKWIECFPWQKVCHYSYPYCCPNNGP